MNAGAPITILAGVHLGCFEVFGKNEIRTLADLKGRTVAQNYNTAGNRPLLTIRISVSIRPPAKLPAPVPLARQLIAKCFAFLRRQRRL